MHNVNKRDTQLSKIVLQIKKHAVAAFNMFMIHTCMELHRYKKVYFKEIFNHKRF